MRYTITISTWWNYDPETGLSDNAVPERPDLGDSPHALDVMRHYGIKYQLACPRPVGDCWVFYGCESHPDSTQEWMHVREETAYDLGLMARYEGKTFHDNPFVQESSEHKDWLQGLGYQLSQYGEQAGTKDMAHIRNAANMAAWLALAAQSGFVAVDAKEESGKAITSADMARISRADEKRARRNAKRLLASERQLTK